MHTLLLFTSFACNFDASSKVEGEDSASFVDMEDVEDDDGGEEAAADDGDENEVDPLRTDDDGDGYTENQGDCDDDDEAILPGAEDVCNDIDDDCDDQLDEDALDEFEPNDTVRAELGLVSSTPISIDAYLHAEEDVDLYEYTVDDGFFDLVLGLEVKLTGSTTDVTYKMVIEDVASGEKLFEEFIVEGVDELLFEQNDRIFGDESGVFEIRITTLGGYGCGRPYRLTVSENTFLR